MALRNFSAIFGVPRDPRGRSFGHTRLGSARLRQRSAVRDWPEAVRGPWVPSAPTPPRASPAQKLTPSPSSWLLAGMEGAAPQPLLRRREGRQPSRQHGSLGPLGPPWLCGIPQYPPHRGPEEGAYLRNLTPSPITSPTAPSPNSQLLEQLAGATLQPLMRAGSPEGDRVAVRDPRDPQGSPPMAMGTLQTCPCGERCPPDPMVTPSHHLPRVGTSPPSSPFHI